jgi:transposase
VRLIGSPGQRNDIAFAHELIEGFAPDVTIADKGYDADHLCAKIAESGGQPVIPPKRSRTFKRPYDTELYKERNIIELLQQAQTTPPHRHTLRQAARQLHGLRQTRRDHHLAQIARLRTY